MSALYVAIASVSAGGAAAVLSAVLALRAAYKMRQSAEIVRNAVDDELWRQHLARVEVRLQDGDGQWHTWINKTTATDKASQADLNHALDALAERVDPSSKAS